MRAVLDLEQDNNHKTGLLVAAEHNGRWSSTFRRLNERAIYAFMTQKPAKEMDAMRVMSGIFGPAAVALILVSPALAQEAPSAPATPDAAQPEGAAPGGSAPANPHAMLPELTGGPLGSPTALHGNPVPGTSTSIPTANPATVTPLPAREGKPVEREDTGIDGQCDPAVSLNTCPQRPEADVTQAVTTDVPDADAVAQPQTGQTVPEEESGSGN